MDTSLLLLEQSDLDFDTRGLLDIDPLSSFDHVTFSDPYSSPSSCSSDYNSSSEDVDALIWENIPEIKVEKDMDSFENALNSLLSRQPQQPVLQQQQQQKPTVFIKEDPARETSVPLNIPIIPMTQAHQAQQPQSNTTRSVDVTLYQKKRGSGGVWQPITQNERIRVDKNKGKLIKVILKESGVPTAASKFDSTSTGLINWTDINNKVQLALLDLAHPDLSAARERDGFTIEKPPRAPRNTSENCSSKEITLKLTKICKSQMFSVTVQTLDGQTFTGRSVQFRSDDNGKVQNANKKRKRPALENPAFLKEVIQQCLMAYSMNLPSEAQVAINANLNANNNNNQQGDLANLLTRSLFPVMLHTINVLSNNNNGSCGSNDTISSADCLAIASAAAAAAAAANPLTNTNSSSFSMTSTTPSSYSTFKSSPTARASCGL